MVATDIHLQPHCLYEYHSDSKVHQFTLQTADRKGMDELLHHLAHAIDTNPASENLTILVDIRPDGLPPFNYTLGAVWHVFAQRRRMPHIRAAYVYEGNRMVNVIERFFRLLRFQNTRRFFELAKDAPLDDVWVWLHEK